MSRPETTTDRCRNVDAEGYRIHAHGERQRNEQLERMLVDRLGDKFRKPIQSSVMAGYASFVAAADRHSPKYAAVLAVAASLILAVGWFARPRDIPESPPPVPSETELQELARRAQRRSLEGAAAYFSDLAADVRPSLAYLVSVGASGILWDDSHVVSVPLPMADHAASVIIRTASGEQGATRESSRRLPLSILQVGVAPPARMPRRAAASAAPGAWVAAVWQTDHAPAYAAANVREVMITSCGIAATREVVVSIPLTAAMSGGGIFNMDRELLGVILPCGDRIAAIEPASVDEMIARIGSVEERVLARSGVLFGRVSPDEQRYFSGTEGLLVREVWMGSRGEAAGLQPGDVAEALNDRPVTSVDHLAALATASATAIELTIRRGSKAQSVTLPPSAAAEASTASNAGVGVMLEPPTPAYRIDTVLPGSRAARAGVKAGDVVRRINHVEPRTRAQVGRAMENAKSTPILLEVERDQRRIALLIPEGPR
jgi:hypothetical protein